MHQDWVGFGAFPFSRMRCEGFSFNSGGLGVELCSRPVVSAFATAVNRPRATAADRGRALRPPLGEALKRVLPGSVIRFV